MPRARQERLEPVPQSNQCSDAEHLLIGVLNAYRQQGWPGFLAVMRSALVVAENHAETPEGVGQTNNILYRRKEEAGVPIKRRAPRKKAEPVSETPDR